MKKFWMLFFVCYTLPLSLKAGFIGLPVLPDLGGVASYPDSVSAFFNGELQEVKEIQTDGGQVEKVYIVTSLNKKWFVKITREDCQACDRTIFRTEWELKKNSKNFYWLKSVNSRLVFPDKGATFTLEGKQHLITKYAWAHGYTLSEIYNFYFNKNRRLDLLKRSFYRYGQVLSLNHFDPAKPVDEVDKLLNRTPRLHLSDRNGRNEKYDERKDRIYLLDLADDIEYIGRNVTVKEELEFWFFSMIDLYLNLDMGALGKCGKDHKCLLIPFENFSNGYVSALPNYDPKVLTLMLKTVYLEIIKYGCEEGYSELCLLQDHLAIR